MSMIDTEPVISRRVIGLRTLFMDKNTMFTEAEVANNPILKYFRYDHLPNNLREVSKQFHDVANYIIIRTPPCAERTVALRKLLESKDAAVRAALP